MVKQPEIVEWWQKKLSYIESWNFPKWINHIKLANFCFLLASKGSECGSNVYREIKRNVRNLFVWKLCYFSLKLWGKSYLKLIHLSHSVTFSLTYLRHCFISFFCGIFKFPTYFCHHLYQERVSMVPNCNIYIFVWKIICRSECLFH